MNPTIERLFVNRDRELDIFCSMLELGSPKCLLTIQAKGGLGKTWLIEKLIHECSSRDLEFAKIDFKDSTITDYLAILRQTRDRYGARFYNSFTELVNRYSDPRRNLMKIGGGNQVQDATDIDVSEIEGSEVTIALRDVIRDNLFAIPEDFDAVRLRDIQHRVTKEFQECLQNQLAEWNKPVVWLFDHFELASTDTSDWLHDRFTAKMRDLEFKGLIVVIAGQQVPEFDLAWKHILHEVVLGGLGSQDFKEYASKLDKSLPEELAVYLHKGFSGNPQKLGIFLDSVIDEGVS